MPFHKNSACKLCILLILAVLLFGSSTTTAASAFSLLHYNAVTAASSSRRTRRRISSASPFVQQQLSNIRGGQQQAPPAETTNLVQEHQDDDMSKQEQVLQQSPLQYASLNPLAWLAPLGTSYKAALEKSPIFTKSLTACLIFGLSDYLAQVIENKSSSSSRSNNSKISDKTNKSKKNSGSSIVWKRTLMSATVGFFYFGPAAHAWYDMIFRLLPGTSLVSTLQKAALGQVLFGPSFTCIFFASSLLQSGQFTWMNWWNKIRQDFYGAWLAGIGFWPLVDVISYSLVPLVYIPLFVNMCSLVWTIYLSKISNRPTNSNNTDQTASSAAASS